MAAKPEPKFKIVADNRKSRYNYEIGETFEAGLVLTGTEVKSLRSGKSTIAESYAHVDRNGEAWLVNANIPEYLSGNRFNHAPKRPRKLLLKTREIAKLAQAVERELLRSRLRRERPRTGRSIGERDGDGVGAGDDRLTADNPFEELFCEHGPERR